MRNRAARILFAVCLGVALGRELEARAERVGIAPRHDRADHDSLHARQLLHTANDLAIEVSGLLAGTLERHRHVHCQHLAHVEAGVGRLKLEQRRGQHCGAGEEDETRGDLGNGEETQTAVRAGRDPDAAAGDAEAIGGVGRRQPRHEGEQYRRNQRQAGADVEQRRVHRQVERPHREPGGVASQHRDHRPGDQHAEQRTGAAEHETLGQERPAQRRRACPERGSHGEFALAADRAGQDQVGDVRAGNDEDEAGRGQQHEQHGPGRRGNLIAQPHRVDRN